jgi:hypothetical protein
LDRGNDLVVTDGFDLRRVSADSVEILVQAGFGAEDVIQDVANDPFGNLTYSRFRTVQRSIQALKIEGIPDQGNVGLDTLDFLVDDGAVQTGGRLFIDVKNVNDPPFGQDVVVSLPENAQQGTLVYVAEAFDQDGDSLTFELSSMVPEDRFEMDSAGNVTVKIGGFDFETIKQYVLTFSVTDENSATAQFSVTINITNINEAPQFPSETVEGFELLENNPMGFSINTLAFDEDGDQLIYQIVSEELDTVFSATQLDTVIWIVPIDTAGLNFESLPNHDITLTLEAHDPGGLADSLEVSFTVLNVNKAPQFLDTIPDQTTVVNSLYSYPIGREFFSDPDNRAFLSPKVPLIILDSSVAPGQDSVWLSFQAAALTLFGTPVPADTGLIILEVRHRRRWIV